MNKNNHEVHFYTMYIAIQLPPYRKPTAITITMIDWLLLITESTANSENRVRHVNALCERNAEFSDVKVCSDLVQTFITYSSAMTHSVVQEQQIRH